MSLPQELKGGKSQTWLCPSLLGTATGPHPESAETPRMGASVYFSRCSGDPAPSSPAPGQTPILEPVSSCLWQATGAPRSGDKRSACGHIQPRKSVFKWAGTPAMGCRQAEGLCVRAQSQDPGTQAEWIVTMMCNLARCLQCAPGHVAPLGGWLRGLVAPGHGFPSVEGPTPRGTVGESAGGYRGLLFHAVTAPSPMSALGGAAGVGQRPNQRGNTPLLFPCSL